MDLKIIEESIVYNDNNLTKRILFATHETLCFVLNLKCGQILPAHKHENSGVVYYVLSGHGLVQINNETEEIKKGVVGYAKGEDDFSIPQVSEDLSLLVVISPNPSNKLYSKAIE